MFENSDNGVFHFTPSEVLPSNIPDLNFYHYTSPEGLLGILNDKTLRFSDCQFLNDKSEYLHIKAPLKTALSLAMKHLHFDYFQSLMDQIPDNFEDIHLKITQGQRGGGIFMKRLNRRYFVLCASYERDSLNMWNYYTKGGNYQGYNLEINLRTLLECFSITKIKDIDIFCGRVIYEEEEQIEILKELLIQADENLHNELEKLKGYDDDYKDYIELNDVAIDEAIGNLLSQIERYRLFFKDTAFSNEKEFRFVIRASMLNGVIDPVLKPNFCVKNGIVTPFFQLSYRNKQIINSITLSPMLDKNLAEIGLKKFLAFKKHSKTIQIRQSVIPIRY